MFDTKFADCSQKMLPVAHRALKTVTTDVKTSMYKKSNLPHAKAKSTRL